MLRRGHIVDRYVVHERIAEGGTSDLYRVHHTVTHAIHCLKVAKEGDREMHRAVVEEGRVQAKVDHPNLVRVTDALEVEGRPAIVMDYVDGPTLGDWIFDHDPTPLGTAVALYREVVRGVQAAHKLGVVHRDLKPENVLLRPLGGGRLQPRVSDFGFAKQLAKGEEATTLSNAYSLIGTPEYMAPEQIMTPGLVTRKSDLYSLGIMLYELVCRVVPFEAETPEEVIQQVMRGVYPSASLYRKGLPQRLERCISALIAHAPDDRPASCAVLLGMLDGVELQLQGLGQA